LAKSTHTYIPRVDSAIQFVDPDTFYILPPLSTVLPHELGSFDIILTSSEKTAVVKDLRRERSEQRSVQTNSRCADPILTVVCDRRFLLSLPRVASSP
jgi:hypothetical protein